MTYNAKVYREQGGSKLVVANGGETEVQSGGELEVQAGAIVKLLDTTALTAATAEINKLDGAPLGTHTIGVGADAGTTIAVTIQLKDGAGNDLAVRGAVLAYLSDDANGDSITGTAPDGGGAIGTDGLAIPLVANKAWLLVSESDGEIDIVFTESAAGTWYLILVSPTGKLQASAAIPFTA